MNATVNNSSILIFYDGSCQMCLKSKALLESADAGHKFKMVPLQDEGTVSRFPQLTPEALRQSMHLVYEDGDTYAGAATYREIGKHISPWSVLGVSLKIYSVLVRIPGMLPIAEWIYQRIANNRYKFIPSTVGGCDDGACQLPHAKQD